MKKIILILLSTSLLSGCGKLSKLIDLQVVSPTQSNQPTQNTQTQPIQTPQPQTQPPQQQPTQPQPIYVYKKYETPIIQVQRVGDAGHDAKIIWSNTNAVSYTVERNSFSLTTTYGWEEIAVINSGYMIVKNAYYSGTHYYRVKANYEDDIVKTSLPVMFSTYNN